MNDPIISADCHIQSEEGPLWVSKKVMRNCNDWLADATRRKQVGGNAARPYGFDLEVLARSAA